MEKIVILVTILLTLYSLFILIKYFLFKCKFNKEKYISKKKLNSDKEIFIVIPCLREQNCIKETIDYFRSITDLPIIIVTTEKESYEYNFDTNIVTTKQIVEEEIIPKYKKIYLIHYPHSSGYMSDQLNYMLDNLDKIKEIDNNKDWYMALYNADSKPSKETFEYIINAVNKGNQVMQQYSYCMKNYDKLSYITKGFALYQSNFEIKTGLYNSYLNFNYLYNYVVGHGLIINVSLLKKLGKFNTSFWCEDIYLTMLLRFKNIKIKPIPQLENIENADTLNKIIKQNSVWFNTTKKYNKIYKDIKKRESKFSFKGLIGYIGEFRCAVNWLCFPFLIITLLLFAVFCKNMLLILLVLFAYSFYICCNYIITINTINLMENKKYKLNLKEYFSLFIAIFISNLGPMHSIIKKEDKKYKTER